jgi:hypothetical protein
VTYFFSGDSFWRFDDVNVVLEESSKASTGKYWFACY